MAATELVALPLAPSIGAEISGIDLSCPLPDATRAGLADALVAHHALFFRNQDLDAAAMDRLAAIFGPAVPHPRGDPAFPAVMPFRSSQVNDFILGTEWHTDATYTAHPPLASMLYFEEAPHAGAELCFADMHAALDALSPAMRDYLSGLTARHEAARSRFGSDRGSDAAFVHPLIVRHPATDRPLLYFSSVYTARIEQVPPREGSAMLRFLREHVANPYFHVRVRLEPGSLILWDNRCTQHLALWNFGDVGISGLRVQVETFVPSEEPAVGLSG